MAALNSFFTFAQPAQNPMYAVERALPSPRSSTHVLDGRDAAALLRAADRLGDKSAVLVRLLLVDGLRLGEVVAADVADLDAEAQPTTLTVERRGRPHPAPLERATARRIERYLGTRRRGPLLLGDSPGRERQRLSRFGADYVLKQVAADAGISASVSANTLRRRHVAAAHDRGDSLDNIRDRVGHRDERTTRRYLSETSGGV
jgi:integrase/recombinase XerD